MTGPHRAVVAFRLAARVANALPERTLAPIERAAARLAVRVLAERRAQVERNVVRVYGDDLAPASVAGIVQETFASYAHYWIESLRLPGTPPEVLDAGVTVEGYAHVEAALAEGKGVILALPHLGGWEWAAYWLTSVKGLAVHAVVEALEPPELTEWFIELRRRFGLELIPLGPGAGTASAKVLRANEVLCLLSDRDLDGGGVAVEFFDEPTTLPGGPATLALRTGATLLSVATYFDGRDGHRLVVDPPLDTTRRGGLRRDVQRVTQELATRLEKRIRVAPEQWHLLQPNWPSDRA